MMISASPARVWQALTDPELTRRYMFNTRAVSDWKVGGSLEWVGPWEGSEKVFVKGTITELEQQRKLSYTVIAPDGPYDDVPQERTTVSIELKGDGDSTLLQVSQGDYGSVTDGRTRYQESKVGWEMALEGLKRVAEGFDES